MIAFASSSAGAQQIVDPNFHPSLDHAEYEADGGPIVMIDEAHSNFLTASGQYEPFARVLRLDGFRVRPLDAVLTPEILEQGDILVIANAWATPPASAFTDGEIESVSDWVRDGGALFLIVDHRPIPGAYEKLASAFGVAWSNGYAQDPNSGGLIVFDRSDGSLEDHAVTDGRNAAERVERVATFAGSAFRAEGAQPLLTFTGDAVSWLPEDTWNLEAGSPAISIKGWQQGAVLRFGEGRIAFFGEAAMFTAQLVGPNQEPAGMNAPVAPQNRQFLLNVVHWLAGSLDPNSVE